jgi:hypothetical protein
MTFIKIRSGENSQILIVSNKKPVFYAIFSNLHIEFMFLTSKINFGNLGNFVTVGDTFILI